MNTRECVVFCVGIVSTMFLLVAAIFMIEISNRVSDLTEELSQPGITSTVTIDQLDLLNKTDDISISITGFEAELNSRLLDLLINAAAMDNRDK